MTRFLHMSNDFHGKHGIKFINIVHSKPLNYFMILSVTQISECFTM